MYPDTPPMSLERSGEMMRWPSAFEQTIFGELDAKGVPYRRGWPDLPPLPLESLNKPVDRIIDFTRRMEIMSRAKQIFEAGGLSTKNHRILFRAPDGIDSEPELTGYLTFLFTADTISDVGKIDRCIVRLRQEFLRNRDTDHIKIECLHTNCLLGAPTYPIGHQDTSVLSKSSEVVDTVVETLSQYGCAWLCVEVVRRGLVPAMMQCPPTVLISTKTAYESYWYTNVLPTLRGKLTGMASEFQIEVLHAESIFGSRRKYKPTITVNETAYEKDVYMGSSIGVENEANQGATLGGAVTLTGGRQPDIQCGITNWHVVCNDRLKKLFEKRAHEALTPNHPTLRNKPHHMDTPSKQDHQGYLGLIQGQLKNYRDNNELADWKTANTHYLEIEKKDRKIGHLHAGSGFRYLRSVRHATDPSTGGKTKDLSQVPRNFALDWALTTASKPTDRQIWNKLPDKEPPPSAAESGLKAKHWCKRWSTFNVNRFDVKVSKIGRTSGYSFGVINAVLITINPDIDDGEFEEMSAEFGFTSVTPGHCFGVVGMNPTPKFMDAGDSGSILLHDGSGVWLGLLFGMTAAGNGMFMSIDHVWQDIKQVTGQRVSEPFYVAPEKVGLAHHEPE